MYANDIPVFFKNVYDCKITHSPEKEQTAPAKQMQSLPPICPNSNTPLVISKKPETTPNATLWLTPKLFKIKHKKPTICEEQSTSKKT